jgi:hypothetical protein
MAILSGVGGRAFGILTAPRATFEAVARAPQWVGILMLTFLLAAGSAAMVLETDIGQLALLDQWEQTAAAFGRDLDDAEYAAMAQASDNGAVYGVLTAFTSGPVLTILLSGGLFAAFRIAIPNAVRFRQVLAVVAHAGVILALRQIVAAPLVYANETLARAATMGIFFVTLDEVSPLARFFAIIDLFVIWWAVVLAIGMSVLYERPARRLAGMFVGAYLMLAIVLTAIMAATGGIA